MRAIVFDRFGEPSDVLAPRDLPVPEPGRGEIRVRMLASPINPSDLLVIRGIAADPPTLPALAGHEGVGIVEASGRGLLGKFLVGRRVAVLNRTGGNWAEQTVIPARQAIPLPRDLPLEQAAMFFINPATAWVMTRRVLKVPRDEWLLQTASGSALGRMVIRLGRRYGFRTLNLVRRPEQADELKALGGDAVLAFDPSHEAPERKAPPLTKGGQGGVERASAPSNSTVPPPAPPYKGGEPSDNKGGEQQSRADGLLVDPADLRDEVHRLTGGRGVRYAIEPVGGRTGSAAIGCLGSGGRMLVYGTLSDEPLSFSPRDLMFPGASVEGFLLPNWIERRNILGKLQVVRQVTRLMRAGVLVSEVGRTFPLEKIHEAVQTAEMPARGGKVLLRMGPM